MGAFLQIHLRLAALLGCALVLLAARITSAEQGFWACGDVTLLSTEWTSDLGRNITVSGTVWAAHPANNATRSQHPTPSWGARPERFIQPLPFVALQRWYPSGTTPGDLGFSVTAMGNGEELLLVDTHIDPWANEWPACDLDGEQVFVDWFWDPARDMSVQVDCGVEGWRVRLRVRFLRGEEGVSRCGASRPSLLSA